MTKDEAIEKVIDAFGAWECEYDTGGDWSEEHEARDMAIEALNSVKHGHWIRRLDTRFGPKLNDTITCSNCSTAFSTDNMIRRIYCPNCGAKMDRGDEEVRRMKHTWYIVPIGEEAEDYDEIFIGVLRQHKALIRCKDCKFWMNNPYSKSTVFGLCFKHKDIAMATDETDWCSWAERKEE